MHSGSLSHTCYLHLRYPSFRNNGEKSFSLGKSMRHILEASEVTDANGGRETLSFSLLVAVTRFMQPQLRGEEMSHCKCLFVRPLGSFHFS